MLVPNAQLHHTAFVVDDLDTALRSWQAVLGAEVELPPTLVTAHQVTVCFLRVGAGRIELVQPMHPDSYAKSGGDGRPDHVCFLCDDLDAVVRQAREVGGVVVRPPVASEAFGGRRMCFLFLRHVGLVEWVER